MAMRRKMSRRGSRKFFRNNARPNRLNRPARLTRGGFRL